MKLCAAYKVFNAEAYISYSIESIYDYVDLIVIFLSVRPWNGPEVKPDSTESIIQSIYDPHKKIVLRVGDWRNNTSDPRFGDTYETNSLLNFIRENHRDVTHYFYIDADEIYRPEHMINLRNLLASCPNTESVSGTWRCYWKSFKYWIDPPEPSRPLVAFKITNDIRFTDIRKVNAKASMVLQQDSFMIHHFSYALPPQAIWFKILNWGHAGEMRDGWFERVWSSWDRHRDMMNLHPCWPEHYKRAVAADAHQLPPVMLKHPYMKFDIIS